MTSDAGQVQRDTCMPGRGTRATRDSDLRARPPRSRPPAPRTRRAPPAAGSGLATAARHHQSRCRNPRCRRHTRCQSRRRPRPSCRRLSLARHILHRRRRPHMLMRCLPRPAGWCRQAHLSCRRCHQLPSLPGTRPCLPDSAKRLCDSCRQAWDPPGSVQGCWLQRTPTAAGACCWDLHAAMRHAPALAPQAAEHGLEPCQAMSRSCLRYRQWQHLCQGWQQGDQAHSGA